MHELWQEGILTVVLISFFGYLYKTNERVPLDGLDDNGLPLYVPKYRFAMMTLLAMIATVIVEGLTEAAFVWLNNLTAYEAFVAKAHGSVTVFFGPAAIADALRRADFSGKEKNEEDPYWPTIDGVVIGLLLSIGM